MKRLFCVLAATAVCCCFTTPTAKAQSDCAGSRIFSEKRCRGDEGSVDEKELLRLINEYRVQSGLPTVVWSDALAMVANRHLLDLQNNVKATSHSWSNCPYDIKDQSTWNCVFAAPQRLGSDYTGRGYENVYRGINQKATPTLALTAWKASPIHNALLTNLTFFKNDVYDACGIAIDGNFAVLWFGTHTGMRQNPASPAVVVNSSSNNGGSTPVDAGLGLNFEKAIAGLNKTVVFPKTPPSFVDRKWTAASADKSIILEIYGSEASVHEATIKIRARLVKNKIDRKTQNALSTFLGNLIPNWEQRNDWAENSLQNLLKNPKTRQSFPVDGKLIEMSSPSADYILLSVKPYKN